MAGSKSHRARSDWRQKDYFLFTPHLERKSEESAESAAVVGCLCRQSTAKLKCKLLNPTSYKVPFCSSPWLLFLPRMWVRWLEKASAVILHPWGNLEDESCSLRIAKKERGGQAPNEIEELSHQLRTAYCQSIYTPDKIQTSVSLMQRLFAFSIVWSMEGPDSNMSN